MDEVIFVCLCVSCSKLQHDFSIFRNNMRNKATCTTDRSIDAMAADPLARRGTRDCHASRLFPKPGSGTGSAVTQGVGCVTQGGDPYQLRRPRSQG